MLTYSEESLKVKPISAEEIKKQERMRDVTLLLQQLVEREEVTLKLIVDCLIDVGSINYANHKLHNPPLNKIMKMLVGYIKPVARMAAIFWVKRNLPNLLTAWLEGKVSFEPIPINKDEALTGDFETVPNSQNKAPAPNERASTLPNLKDLD
ncbi:MAG TPA: hypothetical protein V6C71_19030 [Coleofasciculaceae cyanobacterium]|jgi:hypothetical protein